MLCYFVNKLVRNYLLPWVDPCHISSEVLYSRSKIAPYRSSIYPRPWSWFV